MPISPLNDKVLRYFNQQRRKKMPTCTVLITGHGGEKMNRNDDDLCDSATVYSFAGVMGAAAYAFHDENNRAIALKYLDIMKQYPQATTETIKKKASTMASEIKEIILQNSEEYPFNEIDLWSQQNEKYILTPIKQLLVKNFEFFHSPHVKDRSKFHFGIYITDISYPPNQPPDEKLEQLRGVNIIDPSFLNSDFSDAVEYLQELIHAPANRRLMRKNADLMTSLASISFEDIIILLKKLGFEYSYIFDHSCRAHSSVSESRGPSPESRRAIEDWTTRERNISLKQYKQKMKSADPQKSRRIKSRTIKSLKSANSFRRKEVLEKKQEFYDNIVEFVKKSLQIFNTFTDTTININGNEIIIVVETEEDVWFDIHIKTIFLKIVSVNIIDEGYQQYIEDLNKSAHIKERKKYILFKQELNSMIGKTFDTLE